MLEIRVLNFLVRKIGDDEMYYQDKEKVKDGFLIKLCLIIMLMDSVLSKIKF